MSGSTNPPNQPPPPPEPPPLLLSSRKVQHFDLQADGKSFAAVVNEDLQITLEENPTSGLRWKIVTSGEPTTRLIKEWYEGAPGKAGNRRFLLRAAQPGQARVRLELTRRWDPPGQGKRHLNFELNVR